jgi:hypothetical protein
MFKEYFLKKELVQNLRVEVKGIMKKQLLIIGITLILSIMGLSGCSSTSEDKIIGDWISKMYDDGDYVGRPDLYYTFYGNGTCCAYSIGHYELRNCMSYVFAGQQLIFTYSDGHKTIYEYSFSTDYNQVTLTNEEYPNFTDILERQ